MEIYDFQVEVKGFTPTKKEEQMIRALLDRIQWEGPSDAGVRLEISKGQVLYRTRCEVKSVMKSFVGESASENLFPALKLLERKMHVQIDMWKVSRSNVSRQFMHPATGQEPVSLPA